MEEVEKKREEKKTVKPPIAIEVGTLSLSLLSLFLFVFLLFLALARACSNTSHRSLTWLLDPGEGKMLFRRTNEGEGSEEEDGDGDDDEEAGEFDDENGLDPANPRGRGLSVSRGCCSRGAAGSRAAAVDR